MSVSLGRWGDVKLSAGAHARPEYVDRHTGDYRAFLRRHERAATEAAREGTKAIRAIAPHLFKRVADPRNLRVAWDFLKQHGGSAPGPDGKRYEELENSEVWQMMRSINKALHAGSYRPGPVRKREIPKSKVGSRALTLANRDDRVVQRAILQIVQPLLDPRFDERSFGFRPNRDRRHALAHAEQLTTQGRLVWTVEDLRNAFDRVPRQRLFDVLSRTLPDEIIRQIERVTDNGCKRGLPQGAPISPLLLNAYLDHHLDTKWRKTHPDIPLIRSADDILLLHRTTGEALQAHDSLQRLLLPAGMLLKGTPETTIRDLTASAEANWLGFRIRLGEQGLEVQIAESAWHKLGEGLELAHAYPGTPLRVIPMLQQWIAQQGPCYTHEDRARVYERICAHAAHQAFDELPTAAEFHTSWRAAHARWCRLRDTIQATGSNASGLPAGGSARHAFLSANVRRSEGAPTCAPSLFFPPGERVTLHTDGCCLVDSKVGGWAYMLDARMLTRRVAGSGGLQRTTNNRAELLAVIKGLERLAEPAAVELVVDSEYVALGIAERLPHWKNQGWRAGSRRHKRPLKNIDLWQRLDALLSKHEVSCRWIAGHAGNYLNEHCDRLARDAADKLLRKRRSNGTGTAGQTVARPLTPRSPNHEETRQTRPRAEQRRPVRRSPEKTGSPRPTTD